MSWQRGLARAMGALATIASLTLQPTLAWADSPTSAQPTVVSAPPGVSAQLVERDGVSRMLVRVAPTTVDQAVMLGIDVRSLVRKGHWVAGQYLVYFQNGQDTFSYGRGDDLLVGLRATAAEAGFDVIWRGRPLAPGDQIVISARTPPFANDGVEPPIATPRRCDASVWPPDPRRPA